MPPTDFSIIIPTHARPTQLGRCLAALACLDFPRDTFEVIVVDDGNPMPLSETLSPFQRELSLTLVIQARAGPAAARNAGASRARGNFLAFTDDDCAPATDWLRSFATHLNKSPQSVVGGQTLNALTENIFSSTSQLLIDYLYVYYNRDPNRAHFFASNNFAVSREHFLAMGGFDASFPLAAAEDRDFCDRWLLKGNGFIYAPQAIVQHAHALTFKKFFRQHWEYGRGAVYFHRAHVTRGQGHLNFEPPGFYLGLLAFPCSQRSPSTFTLGLLLTLTQVATISGFVSETVSQSRRKRNRIKGAG